MGNLEAALEELEPSRDRNLSADTLRHWVIAAFRAYDGEQEKPVPSKRRVCVDYGNPGGDPEAKVTVDLHDDGLIEVVDIEQFEPKPQYKLEAGATVGYRDEPEFGRWTVLFVIDTPDSCVVGTDSRKLVFCSDGEKRAASNLTVTKPATPEVGDYVLDRGGRAAQVAEIRDGYQIWTIYPDKQRDWWLRSDITIIAKAK